MHIIFRIIAISGFFSKNDEELDILPPPPPFPKIENEEERLKEAERERDNQGKQRKKEEKNKEKLREQKIKERKENIFNLLHGIGLVKTKEEEKELQKRKKERIKQKEVYRKQKDEEKKRKYKEWIRLEQKKKAIEEKKRQEEIRKKQLEEKRKKRLEEKRKDEAKGQKQKITLMPSLEKESLPEMDIIVKPEDIVKAEKEIQKAIDSMKEPKKSRFTLKGLFGKKEEEKQETIETPEVMPRTFDKIDHVELAEERMHKARMALMDFDFEKAKKIYIEIMRLYNNMSPKEKYQVYQDIKDLYYERKSAERFAKK